MTNPKAIALESFRLIETGEAELAQRIIAPDCVNQEADDDPDDVGRRLPGPAGFLATSQWLRDAFSDLRFELHETVAEEGVVIAAATMTGEHTGAFNGIEPSGKRINHKQVHIFTVAGGRITHHRAVRDDLGVLLQLGWRPGVQR
jgi:predicted ester cyclase